MESKKKEIDSEEHLKALSQRELGRLEVDLRSLQKKQEELYQR